MGWAGFEPTKLPKKEWPEIVAQLFNFTDKASAK
jgi:hypothetical protein